MNISNIFDEEYDLIMDNCYNSQKYHELQQITDAAIECHRKTLSSEQLKSFNEVINLLQNEHSYVVFQCFLLAGNKSNLEASVHKHL